MILVDLVTVMILVNLAILVIWVISEPADSCESHYLGESVNSVDSSEYDDCGKFDDPEHSAASSESDDSGDSLESGDSDDPGEYGESGAFDESHNS